MKPLSNPFRLLLLALWTISAFGAAPTIAPPVNQASYTHPFEPGYGIAQGGMLAIFGTEMGPAELASAQSLPLSTELSGTSVRVTVGGEARDCFLIFTSAGQLAAILPSDTPLGEGQITVTYNGMTSAPQPILVVEHAVGMFTATQDGKGAAVITDANYAPVSYVHSLAPGDVGIAWVTGLGARSADDGPAAAVDFKDWYDVGITVGDVAARVLYAGPSGCCAALGQIIFEVPGGGSEGNAQSVGPAAPENKRTGCAVPVYVKAAGTLSNWTSTSISDDGPVCGDIHGLSSQDISELYDEGSLDFVIARILNLETFAGTTIEAATVAALSAQRQPSEVLLNESYLQTQATSLVNLADYLPPSARLACGVPSTPGVPAAPSPVRNFEIETYLSGELTGTYNASTSQNILQPIPQPVDHFAFAWTEAAPRLTKIYDLAPGINRKNLYDALNAEVSPPYSGILTENFYRDVPSDVTVEVNYRIHGSFKNTFWTTDIVCQSTPLGDDLTSHLFENPDLEVLAVEIFAAASATAEKTPQPEGFPSFVSLQFHDALQFGNFIPAGEDFSFFVDLKALAGSIDLTGACNVNVNNLGAAAGCSHTLADAIGWGLRVVGSDQPFAVGPLGGASEFSESLGLPNWVAGQAAPTVIPDLAAQGQVEIIVFSAEEMIGGILQPGQ